MKTAFASKARIRLIMGTHAKNTYLENTKKKLQKYWRETICSNSLWASRKKLKLLDKFVSLLP